MYKLQR